LAAIVAYSASDLRRAAFYAAAGNASAAS